MPPERIYPTGTRDLAPVAHNSREHGDIFQENKDGFTHVYKLQVNTTLVIILKGGGVICFRLAGINQAQGWINWLPITQAENKGLTRFNQTLPVHFDQA